MDSKNLLLVEGISDQSFFKEFCKNHSLDAEITIAAPRDVGAKKNSKRGAIDHLQVLLAQLADGSRERIALVVDADQIASGGGFENTVNQVIDEITPFGFSSEYTMLPSGGLVFMHTDGLADFGLWVMPNNLDEGILEDWISRSIATVEYALLNHAQTTVTALEKPKFKPVRARKAEVSTWLAWQDKPGEGLYYTIEEELLDRDAPLYSGLLAWLKHLFA